MSVHQVTAAVNKFINDCVMFMHACFFFYTEHASTMFFSSFIAWEM